MKIGTLTFQDADNYGAILQCYALQKTIEALGVDCEVINYKCEYLAHPYSKAALRRKGLMRYILGNINALIRVLRKKNFDNFRRKIPMTRSVTKQDIEKLNEEFDSFIVGSDCVWNDDITDFDKTYLLDFVDDNQKKNSYAASFGFSEIKKNMENDYRILLSQFNHIGVREASGKRIISELTGKNAELVLDPTLLLNKEQWDLVAKPCITVGKYIFVYQLTSLNYLLNTVRRLKHKTGYEAVFIPFPVGGLIKSKCHISCGPREWIYLLKNAEYVVTDSFHATAFSIIYEKNVYCCINELATRITSLLELLGLKQFLFNNNREFELLSNIDYSRANRLLEQEKMKSIEYLKGLFNNEK